MEFKMKKIVLLVLIMAGLLFSQKFGVSLGTGTFAGTDDYSPKHVIGHFYMPFNEKFTLGFSLGFGSAQYNKEIEYADPTANDEKTEISIIGIPLEAEILYSQAIPNSSIKPYLGLGLGIYSYNRDEEADGNNDQDGTFFGLAQFITFGLDISITEKMTMFTQFRKLGFSMIKFTNDIEGGNEREEITDYLSQPGINDLGISAGIKFNF